MIWDIWEIVSGLSHKNLSYSMGLSNIISSIIVIWGFIDNLRYGKDNATDVEMKAAAEKANALTFIENNEFGNSQRWEVNINPNNNRCDKS